MNIFFLHFDPETCAKWHVNKHVVKMILEYTQLLCTAWHETDPTHELFTPQYKSTHKNHPSAVWVRQYVDNYEWLCALGLALCEEYTRRYNKVHKCATLLHALSCNTPPLPQGWCDPPQCMPDQYKDEDSIVAYRNYYCFGKSHILQWKRRKVPKFVLKKLTKKYSYTD